MNEPQNPSAHNQLRSLVDRSNFIGDAGRTASKQSRETDPEGFQNLLSNEVKRHDRKTLEHLGQELTEEEPQGQDFGRIAGELAAQSLAQSAETEKRDVQSQIKDKEEEEAERSGGGGAWRGPQPILGLSVLGAPPANVSVQLNQNEKPRQDRKTEVPAQEILAAEARVKPELVLGLQEIGLASPLIGLGDPRLAGAFPALAADEGWVEAPARNGVSYVWQKGPRAYQRLEWSDAHTMIETAVDERVQWLERRGNVVTVKESGRDSPRKFDGPR
jgi:hypothetical protein